MRWLVIVILFAISGCIQPSKPVWTKVPTASQLLAQVTAESSDYISLDGAAGVSLTTVDKYFSSQQFFLLEKPNRFRTDVLTGFGQLILQLTSDGEDLSVLLNTTVPGRFFHGPASSENIYRFIRIPLPVADLLSLLLYSPPVIDHYYDNVELTAGLLRLTLRGGDMRQQLFFNHQLELVKCYYFKADKKYLTVDYSHFSSASGFPSTIIIEFPEDKTKAKVSFSEFKLNEKIDEEKFHLRKPDNVALEQLL